MSKNSLDDLLKKKLANQEFVFRDEYWADASAFIKTQQPLWKKIAFWRNTAIVTVSILGIGVASYFLLDKNATNATTNNSIVEKASTENTVETTPSISNQAIENKAITPTSETSSSSIDNRSLTVEVNNKITANKFLKTNTKRIAQPENPITTKKPKAIAQITTIQSSNLVFENEIDVDTKAIVAESSAKTSIEAAIESTSEVAKIENQIETYQVLALMPIINELAGMKRDSDYVSERNKKYSTAKWFVPTTVSLMAYNQLKTIDLLSDSATIAQLKTTGVDISAQFQLHPHLQLSAGVAYATRTINWQNEEFYVLKNKIDLQDNSFWNFSHQTIYTPGYKYSQGVAFNDSTASVLTDSTYVQQIDSLQSTESITYYQRKQSFTAHYISVPVVINYVLPLNRFNVLVGIGFRNSFLVKNDFVANPEYDFALIKAPKYSMNIMGNLGCEAILNDRLKLAAGVRYEQLLLNGLQFEHGMNLRPGGIQGYVGTVFRL